MKEKDKNLKRKYSLSDYDPNWKKQFETIKNFLIRVWGNKAIAIEHIGSTSIEGMRAKPLIDVLIIVEKMNHFEEETKMMVKSGYEWSKDYIAPNTLIFFKLGTDGEKTENIHVCKRGSPKEGQFILMRDYLRAHPHKAKEYSDLKQTNTQLYPDDYPAYRAAKKPFLDQVEIEARAWAQETAK